MQIPLDWVKAQFPDLSNLAPLGQGSFKVVFSADHPSDGHVVLKVIQPSQSVEDIKREILAAQKIQSARVPRVFEDGQLSTQLGTCFWVREQRVLGQSVRDLIVQGPFDYRSLLRLGLHTLEVLVKAEEVHIVHRDVKPENLMCDTTGNFWVLDFGIARHLKLPSQTATAAVFGKFTPGYAPAEQFRNIKDDIDARSDLFALGVTLYECATGNNPFHQNANNWLDAIRNVEKIQLPPLNLSFGAADDFRDLVNAMTQKRYDHRPDSAREALDWMQDICAKEQIQ